MTASSLWSYHFDFPSVPLHDCLFCSGSTLDVSLQPPVCGNPRAGVVIFRGPTPLRFLRKMAAKGLKHSDWKYLLSLQISRFSRGYYNILNEKVIFRRRSRRSQPLLSPPRSDVGHVNVRLVGAYRRQTFFHYSFLTERLIPSMSFPPLVSCRETWWVCANL